MEEAVIPLHLLGVPKALVVQGNDDSYISLRATDTKFIEAFTAKEFRLTSFGKSSGFGRPPRHLSKREKPTTSGATSCPTIQDVIKRHGGWRLPTRET